MLHPLRNPDDHATLRDTAARPTECLLIFLPDRLLERGVLSGHGLDALAAQLIGACSHDATRRPAPASPLDPKRLSRVLAHVEAHLGEDLSLEALAAQACLSPYHFARLFQKTVGRSPHRYVTDRRVQVARERLSGDRASLAEIALDLGFGSQANFTRVFRKVTGATPGQFRKHGGSWGTAHA